LKSLGPHVAEHYLSSQAYGVYPSSNDATIALAITGSKYSPSNYWNGRWRSIYTFNPSSNSLIGDIKVDVHYYEDGNVRLFTTKSINIPVTGGSATEIIKALAKAEKAYQEELNRAFGQLSENAFKNLRRQLPITRQKVDWEKIGNYRLGQGKVDVREGVGRLLTRAGRYWWWKSVPVGFFEVSSDSFSVVTCLRFGYTSLSPANPYPPSPITERYSRTPPLSATQ
jgi:hypothetical protein